MALTEITSKGIKDADIATADIADNAITLAKMAGGTDGQIITYDASGNPTAVGPGTDGQVLTSTGAGSPPAFEDAAASVGGANGVDFNDNVKIRSGTGNDFEIYHDGTDSRMKNNTGDVYLDSPSVYIRSDGGSEDAIQAIANGAVNLFHNGTKKLETHSDGVRVINTGADAELRVLSPSGQNGRIELTADAGADNEDNFRLTVDTDQKFKIQGKPSGTYTGFLNIDQSGKVGIGTASIDNLLHVEQSGTGTTAKFQTGGRESSILIQNDARTWKIVNYDYGDNGTDHLGFHDGSSDRVIIQNTGGISFNGDTAAANALDDYEEGTFLPSIYGNSAAGTTTYHGSDNRRGHYTKIGRQVTAHFQVGWTENSGGSGDLMLGGLPFTVDATDYTDPNDTHQAFGACYFYNLACPIDSGSFLHVLSYTYGGIGTAVKFLQMQISGDALAVNMTYGGNESSSVLKYIAGSITYHVA